MKIGKIELEDWWLYDGSGHSSYHRKAILNSEYAEDGKIILVSFYPLTWEVSFWDHLQHLFKSYEKIYGSDKVPHSIDGAKNQIDEFPTKMNNLMAFQ